ncbi:uncharacterized protein [Epargyreus clarus]|uniref:uncharacterized protein n=1 Tax=Epargyreus clarus TaxID=520877 RepID=UPI003C2FA668
MVNAVLLTFFLLTLILVTGFPSDISESHEDKCRSFSSCAMCLDKKYCTWCVTKSRCTQQSCGNDNVIYPKHIKALMSGAQFCPRVIEKKETIFKSGHKEGFVVKITQIYLYMAFTPWKCKVKINDKETVVNAMLISDEVYCQSIELKNDSENPYVSGSVTVLWNYDKSFDGSLPFKVCRADLEPSCAAYPD